MRSYCAPLKEAEVDTLILGCTHYPLVASMLQRMLGPRRSPGHRRPRDRRDGSAHCSNRAGLGSRPGALKAEYRFLCTGEVESFRELGTRFLQMPLGDVERL